ncbi:hypothetical protein KL907_001637 [Ogataea polymorpha]|nr:hypothetical protein KL907_001637 [Ogataea polymorpha]
MTPRRRNVTLAAASAVALLGAASLVVTTYPHLLERLPWCKKKSATENKESEQDSSAETAENIGDSTVVVQENQLTENELKEVLKEVSS